MNDLTQLANTMQAAGLTHPDDIPMAVEILGRPSKWVPNEVLDADIQRAIETGYLPKDPDRRAAALDFIQLAFILYRRKGA